MYNIEKLNDELVKKVEGKVINNYVKISLKNNPEKYCIMPKMFVDKDLERIKKMEVFKDDIWVVTFPKCGTSWTQEMIWMLGNNLDYETSKNVKLHKRFPFLEKTGITIDVFSNDSFEIVKNTPRPRYIRSLLPVFLLPDQLWTIKPKIIYTVRNPKDTSIAYFHQDRDMHLSQVSKNDFIRAFYKDLVMYSPMNDHVVDFWKLRNEPNVLFLYFEDMKKNLDAEVKKATKFLGKSYSQEQIDKLCQYLTFESIKSKRVDKADIIKYVKEKTESSDILPGSVEHVLTAAEIDVLEKYAKDSELKKLGFEYKY